ncbi:hypothetical protein PRJBM_01638 [Bartonella henselae]|uniref:Uncharacterized protein n=2 Tax=Bartonella henselae TaxID=38323 RepID=X5M0X6_BARHN|nr:hypothetical protein Q654_01655 [Bartonella henselae JK 50]ETS05083.1 hypothetical protein Q655_01602 [Bartonella henselae JK 51]CAF28412.1 hypothetical protein BH16510 [Bartonella henselae str. Houston-1]CDO40981.1 hypothetical protein PRJBM_01638 [Bartonella henselae]CDO47677.1 hypothetical protein BM1374165_01706 [Bartonella henselae]
MVKYTTTYQPTKTKSTFNASSRIITKIPKKLLSLYALNSLSRRTIEAPPIKEKTFLSNRQNRCLKFLISLKKQSLKKYTSLYRNFFLVKESRKTERLFFSYSFSLCSETEFLAVIIFYILISFKKLRILG